VRPLLSRRGAVTALQQACELGSFPVGFRGAAMRDARPSWRRRHLLSRWL